MGFFLRAIGLVMLSLDLLANPPESYDVVFGSQVSISYPIVRKNSDESNSGSSPSIGLVYINFREDAHAICAVVKELIPLTPKNIDAIVVVGDKANIIGADLARQLNPPAFYPWFILTSSKPLNPRHREVYKSITSGEKTLYLSREQASALKEKTVLLVDDVLSTGQTVSAALNLLTSINAKVQAICVGFTEGEDRLFFRHQLVDYPIIKAGHLPVFN